MTPIAHIYTEDKVDTSPSMSSATRNTRQDWGSHAPLAKQQVATNSEVGLDREDGGAQGDQPEGQSQQRANIIFLVLLRSFPPGD